MPTTIPANFAAVTLVLRRMLVAAMPPQVEVSTLPLGQAQKLAPRAGAKSRVNLLCYHVSPNPVVRNISLAQPEPARGGRQTAPMNLAYLITVDGTASPDEEQSTERLLEVIWRTIEATPLLASADFTAALPDASATLEARIVAQNLTLTESASLFTSLQAINRPSLAYLVTLTGA